MGKFVGIIGTISGKVGNIVFSKGENGKTYGRTYQPVVANPKTTAQVDQRTKMNLVGKMSQVTPAAAIVAMGDNKRRARAEFNKNLLAVAVIDRDGVGNVTAKIDPADILFSKGAQAILATVSTPAAVTDTGVSLGITLQDAAMAGAYGERIVVAVIDPADKGGYSFVKTLDKVFDDTTAQTINVDFGNTIEDQTMVCVYRCPFVLNETASVTRYQSIANNGTDIIAKLMESANTNIRLWGMSDMAASLVFTRA